MQVFFTSDLHLGHANIAAYCRRPWLKDGDYDFDKKQWTSDPARQCVEGAMSQGLIDNWNGRVKPEDTVFHLGDFCCKGRDRGVKGSMTKAETWEEMLNGKIIHIKGNHDPNNSVKVALNMATIEFAGMIWLLVHRPPSSRAEIPDFCDAVLCGHVHEKWDHKFVDDIPVINVGVDVRRFMPITKNEVVAIYTAVTRGNETRTE